MLTIAVVGLGDIAQKAYLPVIANLGQQVTPVLCTRNAETLQQVQQQYRIEQAYTDYDQLIASQPDAVMIHTATGSHYQLASKALAAGIATFVDKPLSYSYAETQDLVEHAKAAGVPLFVGFNRRYAPQYQHIYQHKDQLDLVEVRYQKNRVNLPDQSRIFVFDDFIHVLDTVRYLGAGSNGHQVTELDKASLQVFARYAEDKQLAAVQLQWQEQGILHSAAMNRIAGAAGERLEVFADDHQWQIDNVTNSLYQSSLSAEHKLSQVKFNDWHSTLYKRGFYNMLQAFIEQVKTGQCPNEQYDEILASHWLAEQLVSSLAS